MKRIMYIGVFLLVAGFLVAITIPQFAAYRAKAPGSNLAYQQAMYQQMAEQASPLRPVNDEPYPDMFFKHYGVNPTIDTSEERLSTFAADVDTASYTLARSFLQSGALPPEEAVRVEEFVNYFDYGYQAPESKAFALTAEAFPSATRKGYHTLVIGLKGKVIEAKDRKPANLVFVIDTSGSMDMDNRLGLVKRSLYFLVNKMRETDSVGIVEYGSSARVVLEPTSGAQTSRIKRAIDSLEPSGVTNAEAGIRLGYDLAHQALIPGGINAIIVLSDGVANFGVTGADGILKVISQRKKDGITISTIGFGMGNYNDILMERLANHGDGNYYYVDRIGQAQRVFESNLTGTLQAIAKDVKLQVEFDQRNVSRFRLIGYENRIMTDRQFQDEKADAGEIGSGHSVTAIYEVKFTNGPADIGALRVRYKDADSGEPQELMLALSSAVVKGSVQEAMPAARLALAAAQLAEKLRGSYWARDVSYETVQAELTSLESVMAQEQDIRELSAMAALALAIDKRAEKFQQDEGWSGEFPRKDT